MRITTQMLNEAARKAGQPLHTTSMLSYVQNKGKTNSLPYDTDIESGRDALLRTRAYEKQEDAARRLETTAKELAAQGEDSIYEAENKTALTKKVTELVTQYNDVLSGLSGSTDLLDTFYRQNLRSLVTDHKEFLSKLGISADKNGQLSVDEQVLRDADTETLKQALSGENGVAAPLSLLASKIADLASSNQQSTQSMYQSNGSAAAAAMRYTNRYDAWG